MAFNVSNGGPWYQSHENWWTHRYKITVLTNARNNYNFKGRWHHQCKLNIEWYKLAVNVMEWILLNSICVNLVGIYFFWSYIHLRNKILFISSIHYVTKLNGQTEQVLSGDRWDSTEGKCEFRGSHLKWSLPSHYHFDSFMHRGVSVKTIDISLNF